jgi:hypothetical protein
LVCCSPISKINSVLQHVDALLILISSSHRRKLYKSVFSFFFQNQKRRNYIKWKFTTVPRSPRRKIQHFVTVAQNPAPVKRRVCRKTCVYVSTVCLDRKNSESLEGQEHNHLNRICYNRKTVTYLTICFS